MLGNHTALNLFLFLCLLDLTFLLFNFSSPWFWPYSQALFPWSPHHSHGFCCKSYTHALWTDFLISALSRVQKCEIKQSKTKIWEESKTQIVRLRYLKPKFITFEIHMTYWMPFIFQTARSSCLNNLLLFLRDEFYRCRKVESRIFTFVLLRWGVQGLNLFVGL